MDHMKHAVITHRLRLNDDTYIETYKGISYELHQSVNQKFLFN